MWIRRQEFDSEHPLKFKVAFLEVARGLCLRFGYRVALHLTGSGSFEGTGGMTPAFSVAVLKSTSAGSYVT